MLLDPDTWRLAPRADSVLGRLGEDLSGRCSAETHPSALELITGPHRFVGDVVAELAELRSMLARDAHAAGLRVAAAGMHPGEFDDDDVAPRGRHQLVHRTMRGIARREPTFALHVHVGVADPEDAIRLMNRLRTHLPLLLALSSASPLWRGRVSGLASSRTIVFQGFPRTGLPRRFDCYGDWLETVHTLMRSGAIPEPTFLWWDIRPQPRFGTVEVRIMDAQPELEATAALCALIQALARLELETGFASEELVGAHEVLAENRFLAARDGVAAELIEPVAGSRVPLAGVLGDVLAAAAPHATALGAASELAKVPAILADPEAARQTALASSAGVDALVADVAARFDPRGPRRRGATFIRGG